MKMKLNRIVSMLTRMAMKFDDASESHGFAVAIDYEHEDRDAGHEHEKSEPEPRRALPSNRSRFWHNQLRSQFGWDGISADSLLTVGVGPMAE